MYDKDFKKILLKNAYDVNFLKFFLAISQEKSLVDKKLKELKSSKPPMPPKISSSSVQTTITAKSFSNLRNSYAEFLKKMKADVVQHCKESKERSNIALLEQLRLEKEKLKYTTTHALSIGL